MTRIIDLLRKCSAVLAIFFVVLLVACGPTVDKPKTPADAKKGAAKQTQLFTDLEAAKLLPTTATVALFVDDVQDLVSLSDRDAFIKDHPKLYTLAQLEVLRLYSRDLLDPQVLDELGVDVHGPAAFAGLDEELEVIALMAKIRDEALLQEKITEIVNTFGGQLEIRQEGDATLLKAFGFPGGLRGWYVFKEGWIIEVLTWQPDDVGDRYATSIAGLKPVDSLAANRAFADALEGARGRQSLDAAALEAYIGFATIAENAIADLDKSDRDTTYADSLRTQLNDARRRGDRGEIDRIEAQLRDNQAWEDGRKRRRAATRKFLREVLRPISGVVLRFERTGSRFEARGYATLALDASWFELLENSPELPTILAVGDTQPAILVSGNFDIATLVHTLEILISTESEEGLKEVRQITLDELGVDLDAELLPLLDGRIGLRVRFDPLKAPARFEESIDLTVTLGIKDEVGAAALIEKLLSQPILAILTQRDEAKGTWLIPVPMWKLIRIALHNNELLVTTEEGVLEHFLAGEQGAWISAKGSEGEFLSKQAGAAGLLLYDYSFVFAFMSAVTSSFGNGLYDPYPETPMSELSRLKKLEIDEQQKASDAAVKVLEEQRTAATIEMIDLLGFTALRGKEVPGGFELEGSFFFGNDTLGLADTVARLVDLGTTIDDLGSQISSTRSTFQQALTTLNDEFYRLRLQDWDNAQRMP